MSLLNPLYFLHSSQQNYSTKFIMRKILVIGSGKSTSYLIKYLLDKSETENLYISVGDINIDHAKQLIKNHQRAKAFILDIFDTNSRSEAIKNADIVISMLPARLHIEVAKDCIAVWKKYGNRFVCKSRNGSFK